MLPWYAYASIAMICIVACDLLQKNMLNNECDLMYVTLCPAVITGLIALVYLLVFENRFLKENIFFSKKYSYIYLIAVLSLLIYYFINCSINGCANPGYAKGLIGTNIIVTTLLSAYLFNEVTLNYQSFLGILLMFIGILIIILNS
jgi:drug/metabolite transporter (DMT)-like permease